MTLSETLRGAFLTLAVVVTTACTGNSGLTTPSGVTTYNPVWIIANWTGGKTGSPSFYDTIGPSDFTGTYCLAESLILENHSTRYQSVFSWAPSTLVFKNACNQPIELVVCRNPGSAANEFPVCNPDGSSTPGSRLASVSLGPNGSGLQSITWRETAVDLELNIFWCGLGDSFALGSFKDVLPTDCIQH